MHRLAMGVALCSNDRPTMERHWDALFEAAGRLVPADSLPVLTALVSQFNSVPWSVEQRRLDVDQNDAGYDSDVRSDSEYSDSGSEDGYIIYTLPPSQRHMQPNYPAAQWAIAERCVRLLDSTLAWPEVQRDALRALVGTMLRSRLRYWNREPLSMVWVRLNQPR